MSYLFQHESNLSFLALAVCVFVFCVFIQWGKGARVVSWILGTMGVAALALGMLNTFMAIGHKASSGTAYVLLGASLAVMLNAARKLRTERRQAEETRPS